MAGDYQREIEELFLRYGKGVGSYLLARVGDPELAEELTARVFLTVVRRFHQLRGPGAGWLWSIVRSELAQHFRGRRLMDLPEAHLLAPEGTPPDLLSQAESQGQLRAALDRLPDPQHEIICLKFFLGLRNQEIAATLGMTPSHVGVTIHRTLKQLRQWLEPSPNGQLT